MKNFLFFILLNSFFVFATQAWAAGYEYRIQFVNRAHSVRPYKDIPIKVSYQDPLKGKEGQAVIFELAGGGTERDVNFKSDEKIDYFYINYISMKGGRTLLKHKRMNIRDKTYPENTPTIEVTGSGSWPTPFKCTCTPKCESDKN